MNGDHVDAEPLCYMCCVTGPVKETTDVQEQVVPMTRANWSDWGGPALLGAGSPERLGLGWYFTLSQSLCFGSRGNTDFSHEPVASPFSLV